MTTEAQLVKENQKLVWHLVHAHSRTCPHIPMEDLYQEGLLGLVEGIRAFNPAKGTKLSTYASFHIHKRVLRYIEVNWSVVKLPDSRRELFNRLRKGTATDREYGQIARELKLPIEEVRQFGSYLYSGDVSRDAHNAARQSLTESAGDEYLASDHGCSKAPEIWRGEHADFHTPEDRLERSWVMERAQTFYRSLQGRDRQVFRRRILEEATISEVAKELGISGPRVCQLEEDLMERFKEFVEGGCDVQ